MTPAFLMGNGPSLGHIDLVKDTVGYDTFGMNAAYRHWEKIDWWPTYYSCLDTVVGDSHYEAIEALVTNSSQNGIERFLLRENIFERIPAEHLGLVDCYEDLVSSGSLPRLPDITTGSHTLLWAQYLGYQTILIAGVDLDYVEQIDQSSLVDGALEITADGQNPNYYFDEYQRPGDRYNIPNPRPNLHKASWANASRHLEFPSVVVNLNKDSALNIVVKNQSLSLLTIGPFIFQSTANHNKLLEKLNAQKHISENVIERAEARIQSLRARDQWCRALVDNELTDPSSIALVFDAALGRFRLSALNEVQAGLAEQERLIVATPDRRLLSEVLMLLYRMSASPTLQRARSIAASAKEKILSMVVPRRVRQISVNENWLDFLSYYRSIRGVAILALNGGLAYLISLPDTHFSIFFLAWCLLSLLLPLAHRR